MNNNMNKIKKGLSKGVVALILLSVGVGLAGGVGVVVNKKMDDMAEQREISKYIN